MRVMGAHWTRRARRDRGRAYERAVDVGRRRMSPLCSSPCSSSATSFRRFSLAEAMAARGERLVWSGSSGALGAHVIRLRHIYNFLIFHANIIQLSYTSDNFLYYFWD